MSENNRWERLIGLMEQQRLLLDDFAGASDDLRRGLHGRDWPALESAFKKLDGMSVKLEGIEHKRQALTRRLCGDESLEHCLASLPPDTRKKFHSVRSELKARIVTVRSRTRGLAAMPTPGPGWGGN